MFITIKDSDTQWLPLSDLMSGLMVIFLFFSLLYVTESQEQITQIAQVQEKHQQVETIIQKDLQELIMPHLVDWNADLQDSTLTIRFFQGDDILFEQGKATMSPYFKEVLDNFFPKYMELIQQPDILDWIETLHIEGHTSSEGDYFKNIELSQQRANAVLYHLWQLKDFSDKDKEWLQQKIASIGMGSRDLIYWNGEEDVQQSRRVTFSLVLKPVPTKTQRNLFTVEPLVLE